MERYVREFFSQFEDDTPSKGSFHRVIVLNENKEITWKEVNQLVPRICKGWYELSRLSTADRLEFVCEHWLAKLPYHSNLDAYISCFFSVLDDIDVVITQRTFDDPFEVCMVYSLQQDAGFFRGALPASDQMITDLRSAFSDIILPKDYTAFLQIHDGFCKTTDSTGLIPSANMPAAYLAFQRMLEETGPVTTYKGKSVNPHTLIPFYESFGMPFFQCFWTDWYPGEEAGNVYYSGATKTIFDVGSNESSAESMAFVSFLDWLMFYMERIET